MVSVSMRSMLFPGVALVTVGAVALGPAFAAPPPMSAPAAAPIPAVYVADIALAGIGRDIYNSLSATVQGLVQWAEFAVGLIPFLGGGIRGQIDINYFGLIQPLIANTVYALSNIVAALNIDTIAIAPRGTPVAIVGEGMTGLDADIAKVVKREKRKLVSGKEANEFVRRQDGWALLQHDVPAVMVSSAYGEIDRIKRFFDTNYHRPGDDLSLDLELGGAAEDVALHVALVRWFAHSATFVRPVK